MFRCDVTGRRVGIWVLAALLAAPGAALGQLTRGALSGTVRDASGAVLPGATLTVTNEGTGLARAVVTSAEGRYRVAALEPGRYALRAELDGFAPVVHAGVPVPTSEEATLDVTLEIATLAESVRVVAAPVSTTLDRTGPTVSAAFDGREAVALPLSADRDLNRLALFSPNVVGVTGASPIAANGQRSRNNNFTVDGSDNNEVTITAATMAVVPEAVAEFQVQTNPYDAAFGRNSGAQVNVITRSGTNAFAGQVYEYYRDARLNARSNLEKASGLAEPAPFTRHQFGAALGGPVLRNRLFFYGLFQGTRGRGASTIGATVRVPTPAGYAALATVPLGTGQSEASRRAVLDRLGFLRDVYARSPLFRSVQAAIVNGVPIETGQVNLARPTPADAAHVFGRLDAQATSRDHLTLRHVQNRLVNGNAYSNTDFGSAFAADEDVRDRNTAVSHTRVFSASLLNEARVSHIRRDLRFPENDPASPTATIGGFFTVGGTSQFPQGRVQDSLQIADVLTVQRGRHVLEAGVDLRYVALDSLAAFDAKGTFAFNNLQDFVNNRAATYRQALQTASFDATQWQLFFFLQHDLRLADGLTTTLGLRYETTTVPLGFFGATEPQVLASRVPGPPRRDTNNLAPRLGLAWSPSAAAGPLGALFGQGRGVMRAGYGIGYDVLFHNLLINAASNYPRVVTGEIGNAFDVYPATTPVSGAAVFSPLATFRNVPEDARTPMSHYWSASFQREVGWKTTMEVGYTGSLGRHALTQLNGNPARLTAEQAAAVRAAQSPFVIPSVQARREDPSIGSRILYATVGSSEYHALFARVDRRLADRLQFGAAYTLGRLTSDSDELLALPDVAQASPQVPQDFAALGEEWSVSAFDRTHRLVARGVVEMPRLKRRVLDAVLGGWQVAGVFQAQSGQPFTVLTGVDSNGNGTGGDRPDAVPGGQIVPDPVTGNLRTFTAVGAFYVPLSSAGTPLASSLGNGTLGRNTLRAAASFNWDLSVSKRVRLAGAHAISIRADVFNLFNQDTYGVPINAMNNLSFGQNTNNWGNRSMTLCARYEF